MRDAPALSPKKCVNDSEWEQVLYLMHALQVAYNQSTMRPWAGEGNDKLVATYFRLKLRALSNMVQEVGRLPMIATIFAGKVGRGFWKLVRRHCRKSSACANYREAKNGLACEQQWADSMHPKEWTARGGGSVGSFNRPVHRLRISHPPVCRALAACLVALDANWLSRMSFY